jgi:hypothetical protein
MAEERREKESILVLSNDLAFGCMMWGILMVLMRRLLIILRLLANPRHFRDSPQLMKVYFRH